MQVRAPVAQWIERSRPKAGVGGSSPSGGARSKRIGGRQLPARRIPAPAIALALGLTLAATACVAPTTSSPEPMGELCSAMQSLTAWVDAGHAVLDAARERDGPSQQKAVDAAWTHYQDARSRNGYAGCLGYQVESLPPEWGPLHGELRAVIADAEPTMLALAKANRRGGRRARDQAPPLPPRRTARRRRNSGRALDPT